MKIVIIDSRNGGTNLTDEATDAMEDARWVFVIELDGNVRRVPGEGAIGKSPEVSFFAARTDDELSAEKAHREAQQLDDRHHDEPNPEQALQRATNVWKN